MDEQRRMNLSAKIRKRWKDCKAIAEHLECDKTFVFDKLYNKIRDSGLIDDAVRGDKTALDLIKGFPQYREDNPIVVSGIDKIKVSMWYIRKMGGLEAAKKALDAAAIAMQAAEGLEE